MAHPKLNFPAVQESGGYKSPGYYNRLMEKQYALIAKVLHWIVDQPDSACSLTDLAEKFDVSASYLQRTFKRHVGISPKQFQKYLTKEAALERLKQGTTVLETTMDVGLSSPGRLHDLLITTEALTPGQARKNAQGVDMNYGSGHTPFGPALIAWTERGISFLGFSSDRLKQDPVTHLRLQWPDANLIEAHQAAQHKLEEIFDKRGHKDLSVLLRGSPFQLKVWEALLKIPPATHVSYGQIANAVGQPAASRAVGSAIGRNPVAWLIPCHRVITSLGKAGGYRWGVSTKSVINAYEASIANG